MAGLQRTMVQASCGREVEMARAAPDLEDQGGEGAKTRRLLGNPQHIGQLLGFRQQKLVWKDAETFSQAGCVWPPGLAKDLRGSDPEQGQGIALDRQGHQRQSKTGDSAGIATGRAVELDNTGGRHTTNGSVEAGGSRPETRLFGHTLPAKHDGVRSGSRRGIQPFWRHAFDLRDLMAQGTQGVLRHGGARHDVVPSLVPVMFL